MALGLAFAQIHQTCQPALKKNASISVAVAKFADDVTFIIVKIRYAWSKLASIMHAEKYSQDAKMPRWLASQENLHNDPSCCGLWRHMQYTDGQRQREGGPYFKEVLN